MRCSGARIRLMSLETNLFDSGEHRFTRGLHPTKHHAASVHVRTRAQRYIELRTTRIKTHRSHAT